MRMLDRLRRDGPEARYTLDDYVGWINEAFQYGGLWYSGTPGYSTTMQGEPAEPIIDDFVGMVMGALRSNSVIFALESVRVRLFSEARFQFQNIRNGRPGNLFGIPSLSLLERPWPGGTTGDLLAKMLLHADLGGNTYMANEGGEVVFLRPDWTEIILAPRMVRGAQVGFTKLGYRYFEGGFAEGKAPVAYLADEVAHFAPMPDPMATFRGMSWLTPCLREIQADKQATRHKLKFFENAATPNLAVKLGDKQQLDATQFEAFIDVMESKHRGVEHAYKTLYTANGADVSVIGANMQQIDFTALSGHSETRLASAAGIHPVVAALSEGLQGSSLNAGNFGQARRSVADGTLRPLWRNAAGSLEVLVPPPAGQGQARLWYDDRDVSFLREDARDAADIEHVKATSIAILVKEGYEPDSVVAAIEAQDMTLLHHSGLLSIQLQPPGNLFPPDNVTKPDATVPPDGAVPVPPTPIPAPKPAAG